MTATHFALAPGVTPYIRSRWPLQVCLSLNAVAAGFTVVLGLWTTALVRTRSIRP